MTHPFSSIRFLLIGQFFPLQTGDEGQRTEKTKAGLQTVKNPEQTAHLRRQSNLGLHINHTSANYV